MMKYFTLPSLHVEEGRNIGLANFSGSFVNVGPRNDSFKAIQFNSYESKQRQKSSVVSAESIE